MNSNTVSLTMVIAWSLDAPVPAFNDSLDVSFGEWPRRANT